MIIKAWFMVAGVFILGNIASYSFRAGDIAWGVFSLVVAVVLGLIAIYEVARSG